MTAGTDLGVSIHAAAPNITSQLFGSGLIGLREGLEAAIVVTILVAFLVKSDRRDALKWVWLGVAAAILMTVAVFLVIQFGENTISGLAAEAIAGIASLVAVAIVTTMVLWMKRAAASMSGELRSDMAARAGNGLDWRCSRWRSWRSAEKASRPRCSWSATPRPRPRGR